MFLWCRSIPESNRKELLSTLESDMMIRSVHDIKATDMGANLIRYIYTYARHFIKYVYLYTSLFSYGILYASLQHDIKAIDMGANVIR